jgi:hypothetical protein
MSNVEYDRSVCPIPWWQDSLSLVHDVQECSSGESDPVEATLHSIQVKLQRLRKDMAYISDRHTILDSTLGHVS